MPRLALVEPKDATGDAARILASAPINIYKGIAADPEVFTTFIGFMRSIGTSGAITKAEKELVMLLAAEDRHCAYCVAAHTRVAAGAGIDAGRALEARRAKASAPKEQALLDFTKAVMAKNGCVSDAELAAFRAAGFDNRSEAGELSQARTFEQRAEVLAEDEVFLGKLCSGAVLIEMAEHQFDASHRRPGIVDE